MSLGETAYFFLWCCSWIISHAYQCGIQTVCHVRSGKNRGKDYWLPVAIPGGHYHLPQMSTKHHQGQCSPSHMLASTSCRFSSFNFFWSYIATNQQILNIISVKQQTEEGWHFCALSAPGVFSLFWLANNFWATYFPWTLSCHTVITTSYEIYVFLIARIKCAKF